MHCPVMCRQIIDLLNPQPGQTFLDCTVGGGGHAFEICRCLKKKGRFIGLDQDREALKAAGHTLGEFGRFVTLAHDNFRNLDKILDERGLCLVNGILFDLGFSSWQLDNPERGFSFRFDGPLDMRMNRDQSLTAGELLNNLPAEELARILRDFGQERWARRIARAIVRRRQKAPISTTGELTALILRSRPRPRTRARIHPATRTFQALRIAVNNELEVLKLGLEKALARLEKGGKIAVLSFHSLEDRIVKNAFRHNPNLVILTKKPVCPDAEEIKLNPRSRSAKLRVARMN